VEEERFVCFSASEFFQAGWQGGRPKERKRRRFLLLTEQPKVYSLKQKKKKAPNTETNTI